ncbi:MAG: hypothetical protein WD077_03090 [Bacteroidia bacterium]
MNKKTIGVILIIFGLAGLIYGGIDYATKDKVLDLGPLEVRAEDDDQIGWPVIAGGILLIGGVIIVASSGKK